MLANMPSVTVKKNEWRLEYKNAEISAMDGGIVSRPASLLANYKLSGPFAAGTFLPNVSSVNTMVFSKEGTFTMSRSGAVYTQDVTGLSEDKAKGTDKINRDTLQLNFANG
jgi:hypothetical protein